MGDPEDERCGCDCRPCRVSRWGVTPHGIERPRWHWTLPWGVTSWRRPRVAIGSDQWCNPCVEFTVPPLGCVALFFPGPMRAMPCPEEWALMGEWQQADYAPCGRYHGGRVNWAAHDHLDGACEEAKRWLETARPE